MGALGMEEKMDNKVIIWNLFIIFQMIKKKGYSNNKKRYYKVSLESVIIQFSGPVKFFSHESQQSLQIYKYIQSNLC